jgi:broad specificity phosphatase PhoE
VLDHRCSPALAALAALLLAGCPRADVAPRTEADAGAEGAAPAAPAVRVFVIRHAEAWKNVEHPPDMTPEQLDALTPRGEAQARALGAYLAGRGVARVVSSPAGRARATAAIVAEAAGSERAESPALAELAAGKTAEGAPVTFGWRVAQWAAGDDPRPVGGESLEDGARRALALLAEQTAGGRSLAVVSHGDVVAALLGEAAGTPIPERWARHEVPTGSVSELVQEGGRWRLVASGVVPEMATAR